MIDSLMALRHKEWEGFAQDIAPLNLSNQLPHNPVVGRWPRYAGGEVPYPHSQYEAKYIFGLKELYQRSQDEKWKERLRDIAEFIVWSQYDENGYNQMLKIKEPRWSFGWPTHNFPWQSGEVYRWKPYEPHHHEDALSVLALIYAYEILGDKKYLERARGWYLKQFPRHGRFPGQWKGNKYFISTYNPQDVPDRNPGVDAVNNVQSLCAMAIASLGFHAQDAMAIDDAIQLLTYLCREQAQDGLWHYCSTEYFRDFGPNYPPLRYEVSYMQGQMWEMVIAIEYLEKAGATNIEHLIAAVKRGEEFLRTHEFEKLVVKNSILEKDDGFIHPQKI